MYPAVNEIVVVEKGHRHTLTDHFRGTTKMVVEQLEPWAASNDRFIDGSIADILSVLAACSFTSGEPRFCRCHPRSIRRALARLQAMGLLVPAVRDGARGFVFKRHAEVTKRLKRSKRCAYTLCGLN